MTYRVLIPRPVQKQLDNLPPEVRTRILHRLEALQEDPRPPGCVLLQQHEGEWRVRVGDYRIRYAIDDRDGVVVLLHCKHRKDAYR